MAAAAADALPVVVVFSKVRLKLELPLPAAAAVEDSKTSLLRLACLLLSSCNQAGFLTSLVTSDLEDEEDSFMLDRLNSIVDEVMDGLSTNPLVFSINEDREPGRSRSKIDLGLCKDLSLTTKLLLVLLVLTKILPLPESVLGLLLLSGTVAFSSSSPLSS